MSSYTKNSGAVVLLPFATPHKNFDINSPFHPAALLQQRDRRARGINQSKDYAAYSSVKVASMLSNDIIATVPAEGIGGTVVRHLLSTFVDPENILTETEILSYTGDGSIADQVRMVFSSRDCKSVIVLWPYQVFNTEQVFAHDGNTKFAFTHPMINVRYPDVPECVVFNTEEDSSDETEVTCKLPMKYEDVDELMKGTYTRVVSVVEITRDEFDEFLQSPDYPDLSKMLRVTLAGKRGVLVNPTGGQFY